MPNRFGSEIKRIRESKHLLQRQVAGELEMDSPMLSKIERGERKARKEQVVLFAKVLKADKDSLLTLWLADQIAGIVEDEDLALKAMQVAEEEVRYQRRHK